MDRVTIYLRTVLFSYGGTDHLPAGVMIIDGHLAERDAASVRVEADTLRDERGRTLLDETLTLIVPWEKIDHMLVIA